MSATNVRHREIQLGDRVTKDRKDYRVLGMTRLVDVNTKKPENRLIVAPVQIGDDGKEVPHRYPLEQFDTDFATVDQVKLAE